MRAVMLEVPRHLLEERRRLGHDRRDEVWEGELHRVPPPAWGHGRINDQLAAFFLLHWELLGLGRTYAEAGIKRPGAAPQPELGVDVPSDYRTPDRCFLLPERWDRAADDGWIHGGPDAVLEVESPGDESRRKLPFYLSVGVREVILVHRDTLAVEVLRAAEAGWTAALADGAGWVTSEVLRTRFRREQADGRAGLRLARVDDPTRTLLVQP